MNRRQRFLIEDYPTSKLAPVSHPHLRLRLAWIVKYHCWVQFYSFAQQCMTWQTQMHELHAFGFFALGVTVTHDHVRCPSRIGCRPEVLAMSKHKHSNCA